MSDYDETYEPYYEAEGAGASAQSEAEEMESVNSYIKELQESKSELIATLIKAKAIVWSYWWDNCYGWTKDALRAQEFANNHQQVLDIEAVIKKATT